MNDFEAMNEMAKQNLDIAMFPDLMDANRTKGGGKITFGVPEPKFTQIINQMLHGNTTHYVVCYMVNKKQFEKIKSGQAIDATTINQKH